MNALDRPELEEVDAFYRGYISTADGIDLFAALQRASDRFTAIMATVPADRGDHRYAEGKWSIKEMLQHLIDTERIMAYRALCFARGESTALPGFDENDYAAASEADRRSLSELIAEHDVVRASTMALFRSFSQDTLLRKGSANNRSFTVRSLGWSIAGHSEHHVRILQERYLAPE